jgi:hypothetical protein
MKILVDNFPLSIFVRMIPSEVRKIEKILHGSESGRRRLFGALAIFNENPLLICWP